MLFIPSSNFSTIIGRIGDSGQPLAVGKTKTLTAASNGPLYLRINDPDHFMWDNTGEITVGIRHKAPPRPVVASAPPAPAPTMASPRFPTRPTAARFAKALPRPDNVAVIIGNADYAKQGKDIPDVVPAYADAESFKRYVIEALGVREGNIIDLRDATGSQMMCVFGSADNPRGQLYDWVLPGRFRVQVYYAGRPRSEFDFAKPGLAVVDYRSPTATRGRPYDSPLGLSLGFLPAGLRRRGPRGRRLGCRVGGTIPRDARAH